MIKLTVILPAILLLSSCSEFLCSSGIDKSQCKSVPVENNQSSSTPPNNGMIELGPVKDAAIAIQTLNGSTLVTSKTDENGFFSLDSDLLKEEVKRFGAELKFVKVVSVGGIDTDFNDDGVKGDEVSVEGKITGIVPLQTLYDVKEYRINFISTALVDILDGQQDVTDEKVSYIIRKLGMPDINNDGVIDILDINSYKMSENNSVAETNLREGFLEYIHNGDKLTQKLFIENLKYEVGFSKPLVKKENGYYLVNLSKEKTTNTIYYGIAKDENYPSFVDYKGEELTLNIDEAIFYQECSVDYGCYKLQKIFFYSDRAYYDYDVERINDDFSSVFAKAEEISNAKTSLVEVDAQISITEKKISDANTRLNKLNELIGSI